MRSEAKGWYEAERSVDAQCGPDAWRRNRRPALESSDAYVVASRVGAAIVAARQHRTKVKDVNKISKALEGFQCDIAGTVLARF
jgi:hypothetical protein